jgi:GntR family transcriptional regulator
MKISFQENIPLYYQVESYLRSQIETGELKPNTKLPSEREYCRIYGISQGTLRKALDSLEREGLIIRKVAKGTFVSSDRERKSSPIEMRFAGFLDDFILQSKRADVRILGMSKIPATGEVAAFFGVEEGERIPQFKRLRIVDDIPIYYVVNYVVPRIGNDITEGDLRQKLTTLEIVRKKFLRPIEYIEQRIEAKKADQEVAQVLHLSVLDPVLHIHMSVFEKDRKPLEKVDMFCRGDRYRIVAELTQRSSFSGDSVKTAG